MLTGRFDLLAGDGMEHTRITISGHIRSHLLQYFRRFVNARPRNMRIGISRAEVRWRSSQVSCVAQIGVWWANQPAGKRNEARIPARLPCNELGRKACALRK